MLRHRGLDPVIVTDSSGPFSDWLRGEGIPTYRVPLTWPNKRWPFPFLRSMWQMRRIVRRHRCQIIHCNEHDTYPVGRYLARFCGLPTIVGVRFTMLRGFCEYAFGGRRKPDRLVFVSRGNLEACRPALTGIVPEADWRVMYNSTDLDDFRPDPTAGGGVSRKTRITPRTADRCGLGPRPVKQLEHLFEVVAGQSDPTVRVAIAGGPVPDHADYAVQIVARGRDQLGNRLSHLGHVTDMHGFLNAIDLFVSTSQAEGCSNSVLQALACGVPVIGYPSVSVDEQVLPDGGAIVPQDRVDLLTTEVNRWLADPDLRKRGGQGARARPRICSMSGRRQNKSGESITKWSVHLRRSDRHNSLILLFDCTRQRILTSQSFAYQGTK